MNESVERWDPPSHDLDAVVEVPTPPIIPDARGAIVAAPLSFTGSAQRIWRWGTADLHPNPWLRALTLIGLVLLIAVAWTLVLNWYFLFGVLVVPYRLIRRGQRKRNVEARRHAELMAAMQQAQR